MNTTRDDINNHLLWYSVLGFINIDMKDLLFKRWMILAENYIQPMREAVRRFRHHVLLVENNNPQLGIYYWVPLPDNRWELMTFFESHYGDLMHDRIWKTEVLPFLFKVWNKQPDLTMRSQLRQAYAGLPRGRVAKTLKGLACYHGNDSPTKHLEVIIKREFNLPTVKLEYDEHERMLPLDKSLVKSVFNW